MTVTIGRRELLAALGGAAAAWPLAARAQQPAKVPTIGFLGSGTPMTAGAWVVAFAQRLRELGWIEGRTIKIDLRWAEGRNDRSAEIVADFVRLKVDARPARHQIRFCHQPENRQDDRHRHSRNATGARRRGDRIKRPKRKVRNETSPPKFSASGR